VRASTGSSLSGGPGQLTVSMATLGPWPRNRVVAPMSLRQPPIWSRAQAG
jgi:hypothetical protein